MRGVKPPIRTCSTQKSVSITLMHSIKPQIKLIQEPTIVTYRDGFGGRVCPHWGEGTVGLCQGHDRAATYGGDHAMCPVGEGSSCGSALRGVGLFRIEPNTPYVGDHNELLDVAQRVRMTWCPELVSNPANLDRYDTIYLGFPIWWYMTPMIVRAFLGQNVLRGKTAVPFCERTDSSIVKAVSEMREAYFGVDFRNVGMVLGYGCGMPGMARRSRYVQAAYDTERSL